MTRFDGLNGRGNAEGPLDASSRLMSSKWERLLRSPGPKSEWFEEWKLLDLDDLELVRSGGLPGGPPKDWWPSCDEYVRVAISGRGGLRRSDSEGIGRLAVRAWKKCALESRFGKQFKEWT